MIVELQNLQVMLPEPPNHFWNNIERRGVLTDRLSDGVVELLEQQPSKGQCNIFKNPGSLIVFN